MEYLFFEFKSYLVKKMYTNNNSNKIIIALIVICANVYGKEVPLQDSSTSVNGKVNKTKSHNGSPPSTIDFNIVHKDSIFIDVFDLNGKHVAQIFKGVLESGRHKFVVVTPEMSSGLYVVCVKSHKEIFRKKILVMK
jgi:hypothetical protein